MGILSGTIDCKSMHLPDESFEIHLNCLLAVFSSATLEPASTVAVASLAV